MAPVTTSRTVVLLALTKMRSGLCLAGIDESSRQWVRPVKAFGAPMVNDIRYEDGSAMAVMDRIAFEFLSPRPQPPHVEDMVVDFVRQRPRLLGRLADEPRAQFLADTAESSANPVTVSRSRSLILCPVEEFAASFDLDSATGRLAATIEAPDLGLTAPTPVTDIRWRALGRVRYADASGTRLPRQRLSGDLGFTSAYLAIGLSREMDGRLWPLVVGVHLVPDYSVTVDLRRP